MNNEVGVETSGGNSMMMTQKINHFFNPKTILLLNPITEPGEFSLMMRFSPLTKTIGKSFELGLLKRERVVKFFFLMASLLFGGGDFLSLTLLFDGGKNGDKLLPNPIIKPNVEVEKYVIPIILKKCCFSFVLFKPLAKN